MRKKSRRKKSRRKRKFCHKDVTYELHKAQKEISRLKRNNKDLIQHYQQENNQLRQQLENCKQKNTHLLFELNQCILDLRQKQILIDMYDNTIGKQNKKRKR